MSGNPASPATEQADLTPDECEQGCITAPYTNTRIEMKNGVVHTIMLRTEVYELLRRWVFDLDAFTHIGFVTYYGFAWACPYIDAEVTVFASDIRGVTGEGWEELELKATPPVGC